MLDDVSQCEMKVNNDEKTVNPILMVYCRSNINVNVCPTLNLLKRSASSSDIIEPIIKRLRVEKKPLTFKNSFRVVIEKNEIFYSNMCAFNSIIHGIISFYDDDYAFQNFVHISNVPFFTTLNRILEAESQHDKEYIWAKYVSDPIDLQQSSVSKFGDISDTVDKLFGDYSKCVLETLCLCGVLRKTWQSILYVLIDPKNPRSLAKIEDTSHSQLINSIHRS